MRCSALPQYFRVRFFAVTRAAAKQLVSMPTTHMAYNRSYGSDSNGLVRLVATQQSGRSRSFLRATRGCDWATVRCSAQAKYFPVKFSAVTKAAEKHLEFVSAMYSFDHVAPTRPSRSPAQRRVRRAPSHDILYLNYNITSVGERIGLVSHRNSDFRCYITLGSTLLNIM